MQFIKFLSVNVFHINRLMCFLVPRLRAANSEYSLLSSSYVRRRCRFHLSSNTMFVALSMLLQILMLLPLLLVPPSSMPTMHETTRKMPKKGVKTRTERRTCICKIAGWWTLNDWHILLSIFFSSLPRSWLAVRCSSKYCICEIA